MGVTGLVWQLRAFKGIKGVFNGYSVAMETFCVTKMTTNNLFTNDCGHLFDIIVTASTEKILQRSAKLMLETVASH